MFTTSYQYGSSDEEFVFACKGRPFATLVSENLPIPSMLLLPAPWLPQPQVWRHATLRGLLQNGGSAALHEYRKKVWRSLKSNVILVFTCLWFYFQSSDSLGRRGRERGRERKECVTIEHSTFYHELLYTSIYIMYLFINICWTQPLASWAQFCF